MKRVISAIAICTAALFWQSAAQAADGHGFVGIGQGVSEPTNDNYRAHVKTGATTNLFGGYMFNDYIGLQAEFDYAFQTPDDDSRKEEWRAANPSSPEDHNPYRHEDEKSHLIGGTVGPRIAFPISDLVELYTVAQGGYFAGLGGRLSHSAPGFSVGAGIDFNVTDNVALGLFGRWNRVYMSPRPKDLGDGQAEDERRGEDIRWATGGVTLTYSFVEAEEPPPPPPAPVARPAAPAGTDVKKKFVLRGVNFDTDKSTIRPDARVILDEAVSTLKAEGEVSIVVEGHTDSRASDTYNEALSERRAQAVADYLESRGIAKSRIQTEGFGESKPVATNDTAEGRAQNRRVELRVK